MSKTQQAYRRWRDIAGWLAWWLEKPRLSPRNQRVFDSYYDSYRRCFTGSTARYYAEQVREMEELILSTVKPKILEVGCGCGTEALWFGLKGASVTGIDINQDRIDVADERLSYLAETGVPLPDVEFVSCSLFDLEVKEKFEIIWLEQAFHHIEPRDGAGARLRECLAPGGIVVISEVNAWNPLIQLNLLCKRGLKTVGSCAGRGGKEHLYGRERVITARKLSKLLGHCGFAEFSVRYFRMLPNFAAADKWVWIERMVPGWFIPAFTHYNLTGVCKNSHLQRKCAAGRTAEKV